MIRLSSPRTTGRTSRGTSAVAVAMSKVTGRSRITTCCSVRAKSWIIGLPCTSMSTLRRIRPDGVEHGVGRPGCRASSCRTRRAARRCPGRGAGGRCSPAGPGCSAGCRRSRTGRRCRARGSARTAAAPPRPAPGSGRACTSTLVLAAKSSPPGVPRTGSPSASATPAERTQRLRYHCACPSRSRTPCTMPSPRNQWCWSPGSSSGFGPDPQVAAVEVAGQLPGDRQVGGGELLADRGEVVAQVAVGAVRGGGAAGDGHVDSW